MSFLFMRHAEADFVPVRKWNPPGWGVEISPLTTAGRAQVLQRLDDIRDYGPDLVLTSPVTRAMECALILQPELRVPVRVEFDLHEWVPDMTFRWHTLEEVLEQVADCESLKGEWPPGETRLWEPYPAVRKRVSGVLERYGGYDNILVICHGQLIHAVTGVRNIENTGLVRWEPEQKHIL